MITIKGNQILGELVSFMERHVGEDMSIGEAAAAVHKSPSTVSHLFTHGLGMSFKRSLTEMKLRAAEEYLQDCPAATVSGAADRGGYLDPAYFSRIYKRYRGRAPREFLKSCRAEKLRELLPFDAPSAASTPDQDVQRPPEK